MVVEHVILRKRAAREGPSAGEYERRDFLASMAMGVGSLLTPVIFSKLRAAIGPLDAGGDGPGGRGADGRRVGARRGRYARAWVAATLAGVAVTTGADMVARRSSAVADAGAAGGGSAGAAGSAGSAGAEGAAGAVCADERRAEGHDDPSDVEAASCETRAVRMHRLRADMRAHRAREVAAVAGVATVAMGGVWTMTAWAALTAPSRLWRRRVVADIGSGPLAVGLAIVGWDFLYYWNHRVGHESRFLWASHVVHHSSERYNLMTALRQPIADFFGSAVPYSLLCLFGVSPEVLATARGVNLLYQFWIHTEVVDHIGRSEAVLNAPSHHRVHHGSNPRYLDRNYGSILIVWDRLFGSFTPEEEPVVYGLTKNIHTFNPGRIAGHEYADILRDVYRSATWGDRLSYALRGPGWAYRRNAERSVGV